MTIETGVPGGDGEGVGVGMDEYDDPPQPNDKLNRSVPSAIRNFIPQRNTKGGPGVRHRLEQLAVYLLKNPGQPLVCLTQRCRRFRAS